jgi:hypothetical protein
VEGLANNLTYIWRDNMGYIADEIEESSTKLKIDFRIMTLEETIEIKEKLAKNFSSTPDSPEQLSWQNLINYSSRHDPQGWQKIADFTKEEPVLLFVNPEVEKSLWYFSSAEELVAVLAESCGFPFCVTSLNAEYMICFDDNDCLINRRSC